jgi:hypothetical protein
MNHFVFKRGVLYDETVLKSEYLNTVDTFRVLINRLDLRNNELDNEVGRMNEVDIANYTKAKSRLEAEDVPTEDKERYEAVINSIEARVYNDTIEKYGVIILNLEEELRLMKLAESFVSQAFQRTQMRINYYWKCARSVYSSLPMEPPTSEELLALKSEKLWGEYDGAWAKRQGKVVEYRDMKENLKPKGIVDNFIMTGKVKV